MITLNDFKYGQTSGWWDDKDYSNDTTMSYSEAHTLYGAPQSTVIQKKKTFTPTHKKRNEFGNKR